MTTATIFAFSVAAALATMTPGPDTALILRTATVEGARCAIMAALGIACGVLVWGSSAAFGLAALFHASAIAFEIVRWAGAAYLLYLGAQMLTRPRTDFASTSPRRRFGMRRFVGVHLAKMEWLTRGFLTNVLNPKVGVFYISFLPQFVPHDVKTPQALMILFALIHAAEAVIWFTALASATQLLAPLLRRGSVVKLMDRVMGMLFVGFGVRLALENRD